MPPRDSGGVSHLSLPFDASIATRLSWPLGDAITDAARRVARLRGADGRVRAAVYDLDGAAVVRVRTPVGRERHYELPGADPVAIAERATERGFCPADDAATAVV